MILPVPHPETVTLHDLSDYPRLFNDCHNSVWASRARQSQSLTNSVEDSLEVHDVGSYQVSICQCLADFDRLNGEVFQLPSTVKQILSEYQQFGFLVCRLKTGPAHSYHPLGYSHRIYRQGQMFVPTKHYHSGGPPEFVSDWDHHVYSLNTTANASSQPALQSNYCQVKLDKLGAPLASCQTMRCFKIQGTYRNTDLVFSLEHVPNNQYTGIDGCQFTAQGIKLTYQTDYQNLATKPVIQAKNGQYYLALNTFIKPVPLLFYGDKVNFKLVKGSKTLTVTDNQTQYKFDLTRAQQVDGQNLIVGNQA